MPDSSERGRMPKEIRGRAKLALAMALKSPDPQIREGLVMMAVELLDLADLLESSEDKEYEAELVRGYVARIQADPGRN
jgi:hypothetical protein